MPLSPEDRARGGKERARRAKFAKAVRVVRPDQLPSESLDDIEGVIAWLRWLAPLVLTGAVDPATSREADRILQTLRAAFNVRDLQRRIRELEKAAKTYQKEKERRR